MPESQLTSTPVTTSNTSNDPSSPGYSRRDLPVSHMAENLVGSEIIKLAGEVKARIAKGEKVHNLTIGDFDPAIFPIPDGFTDRIVAAYRRGETNYPAANGMPALRESISAFLRRRQGLNYTPEQVLVSGGARPLIYAAYQTVVDPQDKVIFPVPSWNNNHYTHLSAANGVFVETTPESAFMPTAELLAPHLEGATLLALCSPLNPTGTAFSASALEAICDLVLEENARRGENEKPLYVLYDQIYWNLVYGKTEHVDPVSLRPDMRHYTIFIDGMSKAFAATGVRVGWGFGPDKVIQKMRSILSHVGAWSPKAEQVAAAEFLADEEMTDAAIDHVKAGVQERLHGYYKGFKKLQEDGFPVEAIAPQGALYLTVKFDLVGKETPDGKRLESIIDVTGYLLEKGHTALVPFSAFGASSESPWYRLSVGTTAKEQVDEVIYDIHMALKQLR